MTNLAKQRRIAAKVLKVGEGRVWIDPESISDVEEAITRADIRDLIEEGVIRKKPKRGVSRGRARIRALKKSLGRRKGHGSRKGTQGARRSKKRQWIIRIRALRRRLKELRAEGVIDKSMYHRLYNKAKGGEIKSVARLEAMIRKEESG
ncbi:MAG: 50S ribosomal protein L19e [Methanophagales archaeon]|nr:50S ribosomal protein L19e [Methanophagales archaeon]MCW3137230.1 50S ribosomal protein L19e [Methanophagales archaeon]MCW3140294.1 50S ribosomal protein L19e [Methanophagales archaeon]MCW7069191.1 50S ribosomal protein L19e [Methanophagales archaeon]MCW7073051.1 50S ribosomal protein L19e [Methanophagales archaeon]